MKKKILVGVLLAVFLLLMVPVNSAVESDIVENNQTMSNNDINKKRIMNRLLLLLGKIKTTNPEIYNKINEIITNYQGGQPDPELCAQLLILIIICFIIVPLAPIAIILLLIFIALGCGEVSNGCYSCLLKDLLETKLLQSN